jgi:hypothetical protein
VVLTGCVERSERVALDRERLARNTHVVGHMRFVMPVAALLPCLFDGDRVSAYRLIPMLVPSV